MERKPILVVEDEAIMRESLRDWLADEGFEVATAEDGEQALEVIGRQEFGIAVLDLRLPGKDGIEVLKEARRQKPDLKAIIITAYPSMETAVEAMKAGAIDYVPKPFMPDTLERLIREALEAAEVGIKPEVTIEEKKIEVARRQEEIATHLEQGKAHFEKGAYATALEEFEKILTIVPGNLEARAWIQKAKAMLKAPKVEVEEGVAEEAKPKYCLWMRMGVISHRLCTRDYDCITCEFDQMMQAQMASGESPEIAATLERLKGLPGNQRACRYALKGDVSYRLCTRLFQCITCEFGQLMQEALEQKLAKLEARREALRKKEARKETKA